jgi:hypothetical protein
MSRFSCIVRYLRDVRGVREVVREVVREAWVWLVGGLWMEWGRCME